MVKFDHFSFNVFNLEKSLAFYEKALGLKPVRERKTDNFSLIFLGDGVSDFTLELTCLHDRTEPYDLGECEYHLAFTAENFEETKKLHQEMECICYENLGMGIYFIEDPDGYWIEIVPKRG